MRLKKGDRIEEVNDTILIEAFKQSGYIEVKAEKVEEPTDEDEVKPKTKKGKKGG